MVALLSNVSDIAEYSTTSRNKQISSISDIGSSGGLLGVKSKSSILIFPDQAERAEEAKNAGPTSPFDLAVKTKYTPLGIMIFGRRGKGKTLMAVNMTYTQAKRWASVGRPKRVLANFWTSFGRYDQYLCEKLILNPMIGEHAIVMLDEVAEILPAMRGNSRLALGFQSMVKNLRKVGTDVVMSTQRVHEVLGSLRFQTDLFVAVEPLLERPPVWIHQVGTFDWWGQYGGRDRSREHFPQPMEAADWRYRLYGSNAGHGHYRTDEVVFGSFSQARDELREQERIRIQSGDDDEHKIWAGDPLPKLSQTEDGQLTLVADNAQQSRARTGEPQTPRGIPLEGAVLKRASEWAQKDAADIKGITTWLTQIGVRTWQDADGRWMVDQSAGLQSQAA